MNSLDIFHNQSLDIASIAIGNINGMSQSIGSTIASFQTNADIGYNPSYAGLSICGPLDVKGDFTNLAYSAVELLGKEKDLDKLAKYVNAAPDPYLTKDEIYDRYIFGRAWEISTSFDGVNFSYSLDRSLEIYGNYPFYRGMPNLADGKMSTFKEDEDKAHFIWDVCLSSYTPAELVSLKVFLYSTTSFGKNPYIARSMAPIIVQKGLTSFAEYGQVAGYQYNDDTFRINSAYDMHVAGTQNGVDAVDISFSNALANISSITYGLYDVEVDSESHLSASHLSISFNKQSASSPSFIDRDVIKLALVNTFDMRFYEQIHLLDTGTTYEDAVVELNKVAGLRQVTKAQLDEIDLSNCNALSDIIIDGNRVLHGYRKLAFKLDESDVFDISSLNYYIPSLNTKYPITFGQAFDLNYQIGESAASAVVKMFNADEVYLLDVQDQNALDDLNSKIIQFMSEWQYELNSIRVYEEYLSVGTDGILNMQKYPLEAPEFFEYVHFYGTNNKIDIDKLGIDVPDNATSALVDIDQSSTDAFSDWTKNTAKLSAASIESGSSFSDTQIDFNYSTLSDTEKQRFKDVAKKFLQVYMGYRKTPNGIVLYANYQNYVNSPFLKMEDGQILVDTIDSTYARIEPGKNAQLDIIVQLKLNENGVPVAFKNILAASYIIYNVSDDKPKFVLEKISQMS